MPAYNKNISTIDQYIETFPEEVRVVLQKVRQTIKDAAPEAQEIIGYGIPTFKLNGNLVHFGGYKDHIGFYPAPSAKEEFKKELSGYEGGKGTIKFYLDKPMPYDLIAKMVKFRVKENLQKKR